CHIFEREEQLLEQLRQDNLESPTKDDIRLLAPGLDSVLASLDMGTSRPDLCDRTSGRDVPMTSDARTLSSPGASRRISSFVGDSRLSWRSCSSSCSSRSKI